MAARTPAKKKPAARKPGASGAALRDYSAKRDFTRTSEPAPQPPRPARGKLAFVVQKHDARRLHFDLRLRYTAHTLPLTGEHPGQWVLLGEVEGVDTDPSVLRGVGKLRDGNGG